MSRKVRFDTEGLARWKKKQEGKRHKNIELIMKQEADKNGERGGKQLQNVTRPIHQYKDHRSKTCCGGKCGIGTS